jgi:hypothetical protein
VTSTEAAPGQRRLRAAAVGAVLAAAAASWIGYRLDTRIQLDDALITYRYARNLAEGAGFVFNPGERVLGTTTPLLALLLGLLARLIGPDRIPLISAALMIPAEAGAALFTYVALRRLGSTFGAALFAVTAFCFHPDTFWTTCGGMETPLVVLFMAAGLWAAASGRPTLAGAASALLFLTRIDGALWAACILAVVLIENRSAFLRSLSAAFAIAAPWLLFAFLYFGSPIPHSVIAKRAIGNAYDVLTMTHLQEFARWIEPALAASSPIGQASGLFFLAVGSFLALRRRSATAARLLPLFPWIFLTALYAGRAPLYFDWYLAPAVYACVLTGSLGLYSLGAALVRHGREHSPRARTWAAIAAVVGFAFLYGVEDVGAVKASASFQRDYQINETSTRRAIGAWLSTHTAPGAVVAMEAVGYQAYYSNRRVIDLAGLVSPAVVGIRRSSFSNAEAFYKVLRDLRPDDLVLRSFEVDENRHYHGGKLFETDEQVAYFAGHYQEAIRFQAPLTEIWGETSYLTIYRRLGS